VANLSALCTGRFYPPWDILVLTSVRDWIQGHSASGRIKSMKNPEDPIENTTCELPVCSPVPQPTAPSHTSIITCSRPISLVLRAYILAIYASLKFLSFLLIYEIWTSCLICSLSTPLPIHHLPLFRCFKQLSFWPDFPTQLYHVLEIIKKCWYNNTLPEQQIFIAWK
jgi:hypothetical protein